VEERISQSDLRPESVPRTNFNYVIIAISFLLLGIVIGAVGYDRFIQNNAALVEQSVARALANDGTIQEALERSIASVLAGQTGGQQQRGPNPEERYEIPVAGNPSIGPSDAPITIVEFSDFRCPYCARFAKETLRPLLESYGDQIQFVYRDFVIFGQPSYEAALASECAHEQDKFWEYHDILFANQQNMGREQFISFAGELDLDVEAFTTCFDEQTYRDAIVADVSFAQELGLSGTPSFFINGRFISGAQPLEVFRGIIDEELASIG